MKNRILVFSVILVSVFCVLRLYPGGLNFGVITATREKVKEVKEAKLEYLKKDRFPTVAIADPLDGSIVSGTVNITVQADDDFAVTKVELRIDSALKGEAASSPYSFLWNTVDYDERCDHKIVATAYDTSGQYASDEKTVLVKNANWNISVIDTVGDIEDNSSKDHSGICLDANDCPHVSYYDRTGQTLKYAKWTGAAWSIETVDSGTETGWRTSIAVDAQGYPHIAYHEHGSFDLKYAKWNGIAWDKALLDEIGSCGHWSSIAFDSSGNPHVSHLRYNPLPLVVRYGSNPGSGWTFEDVAVLEGEDYAPKTSLAVDSSGNPHIVFREKETECILKYSRKTGSTWQTETLASDGSVYYPSIAIDSSDNIHVSYYDDVTKKLKYAKRTGSVWTKETVSSTDYSGGYSSIDVDSNGYPCISCYNYSDKDLISVRWTGSAWLVETVDSTGDVGRGTSVKVDSEELIHISYYDADNKQLKYAVLKK
ncbi:MAG: Ig-like domain-containing protein [Elusimicrobiota bacterium]